MKIPMLSQPAPTPVQATPRTINPNEQLLLARGVCFVDSLQSEKPSEACAYMGSVLHQFMDIVVIADALHKNPLSHVDVLKVQLATGVVPAPVADFVTMNSKACQLAESIEPNAKGYNAAFGWNLENNPIYGGHEQREMLKWLPQSKTLVFRQELLYTNAPTFSLRSMFSELSSVRVFRDYAWSFSEDSDKANSDHLKLPRFKVDRDSVSNKTRPQSEFFDFSEYA